MNTQELNNNTMESIVGGGAIFDVGMELATSGEAAVTGSSTVTGSVYGLAKMTLGGWYLIIGSFTGLLD